MAYLTGLTRALTVTGRAEEHQYRNYHHNATDYSFYTDASVVTYLGTRQVSVSFRILTAGESGGSAGAWLIRWKITPQFFVGDPYNVGATFTSATDVYTAWESYDGVHIPAAPVLFSSDTLGEFTETSLLTQWTGGGGFANTYELRNAVSYSIDYSADFVVRVTHPTGSPTNESFSAALSHSWTQPDSADKGVGAYDWKLEWPGGSGAFFDGATFLPVPWSGLTGGAYQKPCGAACLLAATGLQYATTALAAACGGVQLTGDVTDAVLHNTLHELWYNHVAGDYFYGGFWGQATFPQATVVVEPDWRAEAAAHDYPYDGGTPPTPAINHWHGSTLRGSWTSGATYRYPASDFYRYQQASIDPGGIAVYPAGTPRGTTGSVDTLGSVTFDNGFRKDYGEPAHTGEVNLTPKIADLSGDVFEVDEAWADGYGCLADSDNHVFNAKRYRLQAGAPFDAFTLDVEPSHQFAWFHDATPWNRQTDALFIADNPGYDAGITWALDTGNLKVTVPTGPGLLYTRGSFIARCYAYRWAKLRWKTSAAGMRLRLWLDEITPSGISLPKYAWDFATTTTGWEVQRWDTALPAWDDDPPPGTRTIHRRVFTAVRHPVEAQQFGAGIRVWVELLDPGDYWFDYVEGYHRPDLSITGEDTNRTPLLVLYPNEVRGQEAGPFTATGPVSFTMHVLRAVTNGVRSMDFTYAYSGSGGHPTIRTFWNGIKTNYTDGDTGVTLTPAASDPTTTDYLPIVAAGDIEAPAGLGKAVTPGTGHTFPARSRLSEVWAHYGMGDPVAGTYGATIVLNLERVWDGEVAGNVHEGQSPAPGIAVQLLDNDTEAVRKTGTADADGFYRLPYRYGSADPYSNTPRGGSLVTRHPAVGSALNLQLNAWWLKGAALAEYQDGSDILTDSGLTTRLGYFILERWDNWIDLHGHVPTGADGVDLVETANGWLFAAWHQGAAVKVARSLDRGSTWPLVVTVANDGADDAAPALVVTEKDELYLWYHDATLHGQCWRLPDYLETTPVLVASHPAYTFPRPCWWGDRLLLAYMNGDTLLIDESFDFGVTLAGATSFGTQPHQRASLVTDRFGLAHILYVDASGNLLHRASDSPSTLGTWAGVSTFTSPADQPGLARGARAGFAVWQDGSAWHVDVLRSDLAALGAAGTFPAVSPALLWPGALVDQHEDYWLLLRAAGGGPLLPYVSPDEAQSWIAKAGGGFGP